MKASEFIKYARKFLIAAAAALGILAVALADGTVDPVEWVNIALAGLGALGVYRVPNESVED